MNKVVATASSDGNSYSPLLVEQICTMLEKETSRYCCKDYLKVPDGLVTARTPIDERWRQKSAEWMFKVIDYYDLERDIVNVGMTYVDKMFTDTAYHHMWSQHECTLVVMASLKLAIKLNESRTLNMEDMRKLALSLGNGSNYSANAVIEMEYDILWKLNWNVFPPTVYCIASHMICMLPPEVGQSTRYMIQELVKYMSELAICVYSFVKYKPSLKAFACVLVASESLEGDDCLSHESKRIFLERIHCVFGYGDGDKNIRALGNALRDLLNHNTDLEDFLDLIRASNPQANDDDSPKSSGARLFE